MVSLITAVIGVIKMHNYTQNVCALAQITMHIKPAVIYTIFEMYQSCLPSEMLGKSYVCSALARGTSRGVGEAEWMRCMLK